MATGPRPAITIVVPTYNERDRLDTVVEQILTACARAALRAEVIVVDDNSPDGTGACADAWSRHSPVRVIHRTCKQGLGTAVLEGFAAADSDIVGVMDADLSHPPSLIPALYATLQETDVDMVVASRYVSGGGTREFSAVRAVLSRLGCWLSRPLTPVRDAMSGFFLIRRASAADLRAGTRGFKIGLELLVRARLRRVAEVGYIFIGRTAGQSKMTWGEARRFLQQLIRLYWREWATPRPSHVVVTPADVRTRQESRLEHAL